MEFRILGPLQVRARGQELRPGGGIPGRMLAALLLRPNRVVPLARLVEAAWDDAPPATARRQAQNRLATLRSLLLRAGGGIETHGDGYLLRVGPDELDTMVFERLVDHAATATLAGERQQAVALLREAEALWRGPALAGLGGALIQREAAALEERRLAAVADRLDLQLAMGTHDRALAELPGLVVEYPLHERFVGQWMTALYRSGRQAEALAAYQALATRLAEELGIDPGAELRRLYASVLREDLPPAGARSAAMAPPLVPPDREADLGSRRGVETVSPDPDRPAQLPPDVAGFTGRTADLARLHGLLAEGQTERATVICAIAGTAGVGKTSLAVHWAHLIRDKFADGQLYINLRGHAPAPPVRPIDALALFLRALGVPADRVPTELDEAVGLYRSRLADRRVLILLDNATGAEQVRPLLPGGADSLVIVTSRDALGGLVARDGARRLALDVLSPDEAQALLARLLGEDRVAEQPAATAELAELCGRLPLALRIAAANLDDGRSIVEYAERLRAGNRLSALQIEGDEQAAVRVAFDLSYAALPEPARRTFRLLGLVPGPDFAAPAVAALAGIGPAETEPLLRRLAAAHLLDRGPAGRFTQHDLLRLYAAERTVAEDPGPDRDAALDRLYQWYLHSANAAAESLYPQMARLPVPAGESVRAEFADDTAALSWLETERPNLVAAAVAAARHGPREYAWRLADVLRGYFWMSRHTVDWLAVAQGAVDAARADKHAAGEAAARLSLANLAWGLGQARQAIAHYAQALPLTRQAGWRIGESAALNNMGSLYTEVGEPQRAIESLTAALAIDRELGWHAGVGMRLANLGVVHEQLGRVEMAAGYYLDALEQYTAAGSRDGRAQSLNHLGIAYTELGRFDEAMEHHNRALALYREIGNRYGQAYCLQGQADTHRGAGRLAEAEQAGRDFLALALEIGDRRAEALALVGLAWTELRLGRAEEAGERFRASLAIAAEIEERHCESDALAGLAGVALHSGDFDTALAGATRALEIVVDTQLRLLEGRILGVIADIHLAAGRSAEAAEAAERALAIHRETGSRPDEVRTHAVLAAARTGAAAEVHRRAADDLRRALGLAAV